MVRKPLGVIRKPVLCWRSDWPKEAEFHPVISLEVCSAESVSVALLCRSSTIEGVTLVTRARGGSRDHGTSEPLFPAVPVPGGRAEGNEAWGTRGEYVLADGNIAPWLPCLRAQTMLRGRGPRQAKLRRPAPLGSPYLQSRLGNDALLLLHYYSFPAQADVSVAISASVSTRAS